MKIHRFPLLVLMMVCLLALAVSKTSQAQQDVIEKAKQEGEVIIWTMSFDNSEDFLKGFYKKYPYIKVKIWDGRTEEVVNKTITEAKAGRFSPDILLLSSRGLPRIHKAGLLQKYDFPKRANKWPYQPDHGFWKVHTASVRLPAYNNKLVSKADIPKSWDDLKNSKWLGKAVISSSGADAPLLFADLWKKPNGELNWEKAFSFWREVIKNTKPKVIRGFSRGFDSIASGELSIFILSSTNSGLNFIKKGAPVRFAPVGRTMGSPWAVAIPKTQPHPNASKVFIDYFFTDQGLLTYMDAVNGMAVDPAVAKRAHGNRTMKEIGVEWYLPSDDLRTGENVTKATKWWTSELGVRRGRKGKKKKQ
ncbi:MAG: extracellular solute-binding protein [Deltaproteobacteria bacterium]|nr:extracellular solute-binding protein [Deltaproteobacteria bacterium]